MFSCEKSTLTALTLRDRHFPYSIYIYTHFNKVIMVFSQQRKTTVKCKSKLIILNLKEKSSPPNILFISDPSCSGDEIADDSCKTLDTRDL